MLFTKKSLLFPLFVWLVAAVQLTLSAQEKTDDEKVDFNTQIRPILNTHCIACHGPDEGDRQADLRLDTHEGATEYAIVPGDPEDSDVVARITTDDADDRMPPAEHGDPLKPEEVELIKRWIRQGAQYQVHWSFAPIKMPDVPQVEVLAEKGDPPKVNNEIDNFILRRLKNNGLQQNKSANPAELVRRVSLDLTGLPPQAHGKQIQTAISKYVDSPNASTFESVVDRLLGSPAYAEHWASVWLDIARYADTCGYSGDERRDIWPWRDWLIRTLASDKSYKDMSIEMLAGDLLPDATKEQILATAFHRNTLSNNEGGTNDEEFRTIAVKDRLSTTLNAWMGLTVRCAECHSHKYDPISQVEYYQLLDFFNQSQDADHRDERPKLALEQSRDKAEMKKFNEQIARLKEKIRNEPETWSVLKPKEMNSRAGTDFELLDDGSILAGGPIPETEEYAFTFMAEPGTTINAIRLEALPHKKHSGKVGRSPEGAFVLTQMRLAVASANLSANEDETEKVLAWKSATASFHQAKRHPKLAIRSKVKSGEENGWAVKHPKNGYRVRQEAIFELEEAFEVPEDASESTTFKVYLLFDGKSPQLSMSNVRISCSSISDTVVKYNKKELGRTKRELDSLIKKRDAPIRVPVMKERKKRRDTHVNLRGNFQSKGEKVAAEFPDALKINKEFPMNRLGLAQWIFDEQNPLTARVAANRYWARLMGTGLVVTEEDFGTQGSPPTHPQLLDYLAYRFRDSDWDTRGLIKSIVMSATYQQSQRASRKQLEADPNNQWLSRGPRVRLSAEVVRDQALAVSGLLSSKMYGKPVYPPNPIKHVVNAFTGGHTWHESTGKDRYRRALYTFLKRSAPHPLFETFDMSTRDVCSMRRLRTNTPLQSFMTLNDVTFVEAARSLAAKMIESGKTPAEQIRFGIETALYRPVSGKQVDTLLVVYENNVTRFENNLVQAAELLGKKTTDVEEQDEDAKSKMANHAAMTLVCNVILNLDSFLNN